MLEAADVEPSKTTVPFMSLEGSDDAEKFGWTSYLGKDLEEAIPADQIESLCEVYEGRQRRVVAFAPYISLEVV